MRISFLLLALGLIAYPAPAQTPADTTRVQTLLDKAHAYTYRPGATISVYDSALQFATEAATLSRAIGYKPGLQRAGFASAEAHMIAHRFPQAWTWYPGLDDTSRVRFLSTLIYYRIYPFAAPQYTNNDTAAAIAARLEPLLPMARSAKLILDAYATTAGAWHHKGDKKHAMDLYREGFQRIRSAGDINLENEFLSRLAFFCYDDTTMTPLFFSLLPQLEADDDRLLPKVDSARQYAAVFCVASIGNSFYYGKQLDACLRISATAIHLNELLHQHIALPYSWQAYIYTSQGKTKEGLAASLAAVRVTETPNGPIDASGYEAASRTYFIIGNLDKSLEYIYKALPLFQRDPSLVHNPGGLFHRAVEILLQQHKPTQALQLLQIVNHPSSPVGYTFIDREYFAISTGDCLFALGKKDSAEYYYRDALRNTYPMTGFNPGKAMVYNSLAHFYTATHQYARARPYLDTLMADSNHALTTLSMMEDAQLSRFEADSARGDYRNAITHLRAYQQLHDSVINVAKNKQLTEMTVQYETENKNKDIADLEKQNALQTRLQEVTTRQNRIVRNSLIAGAALLAIIAAGFYSRARTRRRMNRRLEKLTHRQHKLLKEKEWLLREIHHRVKNNLQIIMSLLRMQSNQLKDETAIDAFAEIGARVNTISLVHKKLYQEEQDMASINMREYIRDLIEFLRDGFGTHRSIAFRLEVDELFLDVSQAIPLGLILNEAITNAIKYAFPAAVSAPATAPTITISLHEQPAPAITLQIADNGIGLPPGFDPENSPTLGLQLIQTLSAQLEGALVMTNDPGLNISIRFIRHTNPLHQSNPATARSVSLK